MLEAPEVEAHRHHKTGHSLFDFILGGTAVFLSMVSVFIAVHHGQTMEKLVAANSWPNLSYGTGNQTGDGRDVITFTIRNTGVGPARIDTFELFYKDKPMADLHDLSVACCAQAHGRHYFATDSILDEVIPARESISFLSLPRDKNVPEIWDLLNQERFNVRVRACYCSVFDECWVMDSAQRRPERHAGECTPSQPVQFSIP
jgi:hypothetical protein